MTSPNASPKLGLVRRLASILLVTVFLALGTGALQYLHNLKHAREDAREDAIAKSSGQPLEHHQHDESNCFVHAQLHVPTISAGWVPLLVFLGLFVAFLTQIATPLVSQTRIFRIACRGPPE